MNVESHSRSSRLVALAVALSVATGSAPAGAAQAARAAPVGAPMAQLPNGAIQNPQSPQATGAWTQTDWTGGPGQTGVAASNTTRFDQSTSTDYSRADLLQLRASGSDQNVSYDFNEDGQLDLAFSNYCSHSACSSVSFVQPEAKSLKQMQF